MTRKLTYGDFESTGFQDCDNVFEADDFDLQSTESPGEVVRTQFVEWEAAGGEEDWIKQQSGDFDDLDPHLAYEAWRKGWSRCAVVHVRRLMSRTLNRLERKFFEIVQDADPSSVDIAEDFAIQHELKLRVLGWKGALVSNIVDDDDEELSRGQFGNDLFKHKESPHVIASEWNFNDYSGDIWLTRIYGGKTWVAYTGQHKLEKIALGTKLADTAAQMAWRDYKIMVRNQGKSPDAMSTLLDLNRGVEVPEEIINPSRRRARANPADPEARDEERAVDKYREFNAFDPKELVYDASFKMPARVRSLGDGKEILYESMKVIPDNGVRPRKPQAYIHEFEGDVIGYACDGAADTDVPTFIREVDALALLGKCLGFTCKGAEARGEHPLPELYATPCGRALIVIQSKKTVLAMFWGGALNVEPRGITG